MLKKIWNVSWSILEFIVIIYVIFMTSILLSKNMFGFTQFGKYTISSINLMDEKNIKDAHDGDLLIVENSSDIKKGDVIYYYAVYENRYIIRSDVVTDVEQDDLSVVYTVDRDLLITISDNVVLGKYIKLYSNVGFVLRVIESKLGFLFLVLLPILIIFIYQVYEFIIILKYEKVEEVEVL